MKTKGDDSVYPSIDEQKAEQDSFGIIRTEFIGSNGLTKREYFAAMAMQNMTRINFNEAHPYEVAEKSVKFADALIKELNKEVKE